MNGLRVMKFLVTQVCAILLSLPISAEMPGQPTNRVILNTKPSVRVDWIIGGGSKSLYNFRMDPGGLRLFATFEEGI